jgi:ABC-type glycerol-3-phosphate transport system permease component
MQPPRRVLSRIGELLPFAALALACAFALVPIYWAVNTSLKFEEDIDSYPPEWLPDPLTIDHYVNIISSSTLPRNYLNSVILAAGTIVLVLILGVHAGYAAARFDFRGKNAILFLMLSTVMIPGIVTLIPQYFLAVQLGLYDQLIVLFLVFGAWQLPTVVWIMRGFFQGIPRELDESALVDGSNRIGAFYRIIMPLSWPGIASAAIVVFVWVWNEFIIALNLTASQSTRPLTVGVFFFVGESGIEWGRMSAAAIIGLIPAIVAFIMLQRRFVAGLTAGSIKG